jgi:hypothetical protein
VQVPVTITKRKNVPKKSNLASDLSCLIFIHS